MISKRIPDWLKIDLTVSTVFKEVSSLIADEKLNTVCREARCPNIAECWSKKHATFLLLGEFCTRDCLFCSVKKTDTPPELKENEAERVFNAVRKMALKYVVLTSVTRDDLKDGGASVFAAVVKKIKEFDDTVLTEVLVPDFMGKSENIQRVLDANPDVFSHNIEMPEELYPKYRKKASYQRSLSVLKEASSLRKDTVIKSGLMLGLGETEENVRKVFSELLKNGVEILVLGQYLRPSADSAAVVEYIKPDKIDFYRDLALSIGFKEVVASPFARTSYQAREAFMKVLSLKNISKKCKNKA